MTQTQSRKKNLFQMNVDLMHGPIFRSLVLFMLPILISNLFQQLYNTVDTMIVGNVLGDTARSTSFWLVLALASATALPSWQRAPTALRTRTCSSARWPGRWSSDWWRR